MWCCRRPAPGSPCWPATPSRPLLSHQPLPGELPEPRLRRCPIRLETIQRSRRSRHRQLFCSRSEPCCNRQVDRPVLDDLRKAQVYPATCRIQTGSSPLAWIARVQPVSRTETQPDGCHRQRSSVHGLITLFPLRTSRLRGDRGRCGLPSFQDLETHHGPSGTDDLLDTLCLVLLSRSQRRLEKPQRRCLRSQGRSHDASLVAGRR